MARVPFPKQNSPNNFWIQFFWNRFWDFGCDTFSLSYVIFFFFLEHVTHNLWQKSPLMMELFFFENGNGLLALTYFCKKLHQMFDRVLNTPLAVWIKQIIPKILLTWSLNRSSTMYWLGIRSRTIWMCLIVFLHQLTSYNSLQWLIIMRSR